MLNMDIIPIYHAIRFIAGILKYNSASILNLAGSGRCLVLIYFTFKAPYILLLFNITMPDIYCIKNKKFLQKLQNHNVYQKCINLDVSYCSFVYWNRWCVVKKMRQKTQWNDVMSSDLTFIEFVKNGQEGSWTVRTWSCQYLLEGVRHSPPALLKAQ